MRLRDLFRNPTNNERKLTPSIIPILDVNTFISAASEKDTETLQKYLFAGFPPDQFDPATKSTALHISVELANLRAIQVLLQAGAQVNIYDGSSSTPLHIAAYMGYEEIVQILLAYGADIFKLDNTGRSSFHLAASTGNNRVLQFLISNVDYEQNIINMRDAQNWTALMCACASNHSHTCALLVSHGADICAINDRGMNVFHLASFLGSLSIIHELINSNIDDEIILKALNQGDYRNQTPLFYACIEGHFDIALTLYHAGANAYHLDNDNQTCLHAMLSSSIILKRHIRLFYRFIEYVDYRFHQDYINRTLLDLAYIYQLNTIIYLLTILNYKRNYAIISNNEYNDNCLTQVHSLRQLCIIQFKRSINYQQNTKQLSQYELLENALQQCFHINLPKEIDSNEFNYRKSLDDMSISSKKHSKSTKKSRRIQNDIDQQPPQHTQSSWSIFTNKFKHQRPSSIIQTNNLSHLIVSTNENHPMKNLALAMLLSPRKLHDLLAFPSLNNNHLLYDDMKTIMNVYNLEGTDLSNQI